MSDTPINTNPKELPFWQDRVTKSSGLAVFLPSDLHPELKEILAIEKEATDLSKKVARLQVNGTTRMNNLWLKVREHLEKNGRPDNWVDELGLDAVALDNGFFVVNILPKNK